MYLILQIVWLLISSASLQAIPIVSKYSMLFPTSQAYPLFSNILTTRWPGAAPVTTLHSLHKCIHAQFMLCTLRGKVMKAKFIPGNACAFSSQEHLVLTCTYWREAGREEDIKWVDQHNSVLYFTWQVLWKVTLPISHCSLHLTLLNFSKTHLTIGTDEVTQEIYFRHPIVKSRNVILPEENKHNLAFYMFNLKAVLSMPSSFLLL